MDMLNYIAKIQRKLIDEYGFKENPEKPGLPIGVPAGEYPMEIEEKIDNVIVDEKGFLHCCNFTEEATE